MPQVIGRRRNYLVNKRYQGRFIAAFLGASLAGMATAAAVTLHYINSGLDRQIYRSHIALVSADQVVLPIAVKVSLVFFLAGVVVIGVLGLYYATRAEHLVSGFTEGFRRVREGELDFRMEIGEHNEFPDLEKVMNLAISETARRVKALKRMAADMENEVALLGEFDKRGVGENMAVMRALKEKINRFEDTLAGFKLEG
jgi:methyl-accepting chemotaxis protein